MSQNLKSSRTALFRSQKVTLKLTSNIQNLLIKLKKYADHSYLRCAGVLSNISSVVEFQRWRVLKRKLFAQESTCSKEILIPTMYFEPLMTLSS